MVAVAFIPQWKCVNVVGLSGILVMQNVEGFRYPDVDGSTCRVDTDYHYRRSRSKDRNRNTAWQINIVDAREC